MKVFAQKLERIQKSPVIRVNLAQSNVHDGQHPTFKRG